MPGERRPRCPLTMPPQPLPVRRTIGSSTTSPSAVRSVGAARAAGSCARRPPPGGGATASQRRDARSRRGRAARSRHALASARPTRPARLAVAAAPFGAGRTLPGRSCGFRRPVRVWAVGALTGRRDHLTLLPCQSCPCAIVRAGLLGGHSAPACPAPGGRRGARPGSATCVSTCTPTTFPSPTSRRWTAGATPMRSGRASRAVGEHAPRRARGPARQPRHRPPGHLGRLAGAVPREGRRRGDGRPAGERHLCRRVARATADATRPSPPCRCPTSTKRWRKSGAASTRWACSA